MQARRIEALLVRRTCSISPLLKTFRVASLLGATQNKPYSCSRRSIRTSCVCSRAYGNGRLKFWADKPGLEWLTIDGGCCKISPHAVGVGAAARVKDAQNRFWVWFLWQAARFFKKWIYAFDMASEYAIIHCQSASIKNLRTSLLKSS